MNAKTFQDRRLALADLLPGIPALFYSGLAQSRNSPHNVYPFRPSSHYLYFGGPSEPNAFLLVLNGEGWLFLDLPGPEQAVWTGQRWTAESLTETFGLQRVSSLSELSSTLVELQREEVLALPMANASSALELERVLERKPDLGGDFDSDLAQAVVHLRLHHDAGALEGLRLAAEVTVSAHRSLYGRIVPGTRESELMSNLLKTVLSRGMGASFEPIVSVHGEVLHNPHYTNQLGESDLLVVDFGAETSHGWAGDVTRTYPVGGDFTTEQRQAYELVLRAQREAIAMVRPGVLYKDVHLKACQVMAEGLVELGLLKGKPQELVERGAHALFFPHGVGHLLGLDVHDMEDLGDLAGYEEGEERSEQFGLCYLRLQRELEPGMAVTIEPGFYWIPQLLEGERVEPFRDCLDREAMERFRHVRGIRIEDEVLVTEGGHEVLTEGLAKDPDEVAALAVNS